MNKSLEFVKKRFEELGKNWDYEDENVEIHSPESFFRRVRLFQHSFKLENPTIVGLSSENTLAMGYQLTLFNDEKIDVKVAIADDDFDNFDFFNAHSEHNDGTQLFVYQDMDKVFSEVATCKVAPLTKISSISDLEGVQKLNIILGDIIVCQKEDTSPDPERLWMTNRLEVFLPAHFELIK